MSSILLRNLFNELLFRNSLAELFAELVIKARLLKGVVNEENKPIIKILGNTISMLSADNGWPELMLFILDCVDSEDFWLQESALLVFVRFGMGHSMATHNAFTGVFMMCLGNVGSADVRIRRCLRRFIRF